MTNAQMVKRQEIKAPALENYVRGTFDPKGPNVAKLLMVAEEAHKDVDAKERRWPFRDPLEVRPIEGKDGIKWEILDGVTRYAVATILGWPEVPIVVNKTVKTEGDAFLRQIETNDGHGIGLSREQRDNAIRRLHSVYGMDLPALTARFTSLSKSSLSRIVNFKQGAAATGGVESRPQSKKGKKKGKRKGGVKKGDLPTTEEWYSAAQLLLRAFRANSQEIIGGKGMMQPEHIQHCGEMFAHVMHATPLDQLPTHLRPVVDNSSTPVGG